MFKELANVFWFGVGIKKSDFKFFFNKTEEASLLFPETALTNEFPKFKDEGMQEQKTKFV